jgi:predicted dithiol-disulfide oxidoreductase (DUF899 family)
MKQNAKINLRRQLEMATQEKPMDKEYFPPAESASKTEWKAAHDTLLAKEKAATRARDALAAERRRLPRLRIDKNYVFEGPDGRASLLDMFSGRRQLILYSFMFAPGVHGWPSAGCPGCSFLVDNIGNTSHLQARDVSLVLVSIAPLANIEQYKKRMGWTLPWYSSANNEFNADIGVTTDKGEDHRVNVFLRQGDQIYYTYYTSQRGTEVIGATWGLLDMTPFGRQENWEDSPAGTPQSPPYQWWRRHDEYGKPPRHGA